jgi:ribosomal protein L40E
MKERRTKVEEIKKKTNYYSTRDLLQRYDDSTPTNTPVISRTLPGQNTPGQPSTPIRQPVRQPVPQHPNLGQTSGVNPRLARAPSPPSRTCPFSHSFIEVMSPPFAATPPRKQWYDKLADKLLGDDEQYNVSPGSRYALICEKCFAHNGLVKESMWEDARMFASFRPLILLTSCFSEYLCMKCNHFNPSMRSKRQARLSQISPASSPISSPVNEGITAHPMQLSPSQQPGSDLPTVDAPTSASMDVDS